MSADISSAPSSGPTAVAASANARHRCRSTSVGAWSARAVSCSSSRSHSPCGVGQSPASRRASAGYLEALTNHAGDIVRITAISGEARRLAGLWPTPQGEWDRLLEQLTARAGQAPTEVERQRWRAFAEAAAAVGPDDGALLMSALIGGYVPRRR